jgi:mono/diheme cytochrome c family protein
VQAESNCRDGSSRSAAHQPAVSPRIRGCPGGVISDDSPAKEDRESIQMIRPFSWLFGICTATCLFWLTSCNRSDAELAYWTPNDHKNVANPGTAAEQSSGVADPSRPAGLDDVTLATWKQNCVLCHGQLGRGDGPQGPLLGARDLSLPEFQASVSDENMAEVIRRGRNRMPAFSQLPESTVASLVKLIRLFGQARAAAGSSKPATGAAPGAANAHPSPPASAAAARPTPGTASP